MMKKAKLDDLYKELWLRRRNSGELVWDSKNGNVPIKDMTDEHLKNAIDMAEREDYMLECWCDYEASLY